MSLATRTPQIVLSQPGLGPRPAVPARLVASAIVLVALVTSPAFANDDEWSVRWKNGTRIESADGQFQLKIGGRVQADFSFAETGGDLADSFSIDDGSELRRARLFVAGTLYERVEFKAQVDFAGGDAAPKDVYVGLVGLPGVGGLRIGHFKEPFGLEELTSSKYLAFLERSAPLEAFAPSRNMGLMLHNAVRDERITWAAGIFQNSDGFARAGGGNWNLTARVTGLASYRDGGKHLVHLGAAISRRDPDDDTVRFRARPQAHLSPRLADTGKIAATGADLAGLEAAVVEGPFWAEAEWMRASTDSPSSADLSGISVQAGWFLTGESRAYKKSAGTFDRLKPASDFLRDGGRGAWEIAVRYNRVDLADGPVRGGELDGYGVALNWYLNSASRVMLDYVTSELEGKSGSADFVLLRFQVDF